VRKLADFQTYYNHHRTHSSLGGDTPTEFAGEPTKMQTTLNNFRWQTHCRGLYQLPAAALLSIRHAQPTHEAAAPDYQSFAATYAQSLGNGSFSCSVSGHCFSADANSNGQA
jgi:hypothetical protein